jgi:hypothetical protein
VLLEDGEGHGGAAGRRFQGHQVQPGDGVEKQLSEVSRWLTGHPWSQFSYHCIYNFNIGILLILSVGYQVEE